MSTVNQIYSIINYVAKQTCGETAVNVADTSTLVALGDAVLSSDTNTDKFTHALVDRIGRTVFSVRRYLTRESGMIREPFEYGCIVQKIYVDMPEAKQNNSWEIGEDSYKPEFAPVIKPTVKQKLFNKIATWEIGEDSYKPEFAPVIKPTVKHKPFNKLTTSETDVTIPDFIFRTAFK